VPNDIIFDEIHVIESVKESDGDPGRQLVARWNSTAQTIPMFGYFVFDREDLYETLAKIKACTTDKGLVPLLHFEGHGSDYGFELRKQGECISWEEFGAILWDFNRASGFNLFGAFSCCYGIRQLKTMTTSQPCPFSRVIGCDHKAFTAELFEGFYSFYEVLVKTGSGKLALEALTAQISSDARFSFIRAEDAFREVYRLVLEQYRSPGFIDEMRKRHLAAIESQPDLFRGKKISSADIDIAFAISDFMNLREFHERFFGCAEVPLNRTRFPLEKLIIGL
jgi:hypothetical protein